MAKRKRQRMQTREQRAAARAAREAEARRLGPEEMQRLADVRTINAVLGADVAQHELTLAAAFEDVEEMASAAFGAVLARQYERLTGRTLTAAEAERRCNEEEDRIEAEQERAYFEKGLI